MVRVYDERETEQRGITRAGGRAGAMDKEGTAPPLINQLERRPIIAIVHEPHPRSKRSVIACACKSLRVPAVSACGTGPIRRRIRIRYFVTDAGP